MAQPTLLKTIIALNMLVVMFIFLNDIDLKRMAKKNKLFKVELNIFNNFEKNHVNDNQNRLIDMKSNVIPSTKISVKKLEPSNYGSLDVSQNGSYERVNACIIVLLRNSDLELFVEAITKFEINFNKRYHYPYVLFNNEEFTTNFKETIVKYTNSTMEFGTIPVEQWSMPDWIDRVKMADMYEKEGIMNIWGEDYRHMCRFYSGFFFRHELTLKYDYYWRIDDDSYFPCEITYDPFLLMKQKDKVYGFTFGQREEPRTIATLWSSIKSWLDTGYRDQIAKEKNSLKFLTYDNGDSLATSYCIFLNNFEIGKFSIFRDDRYLNFFNYLDKAGGFYYERWGDAPVHTYYVTLMYNRSDIHLFSDVPYAHGHEQKTRNYRNVSNKCEPWLTRCTKKWVAVSQLDKWINNP